MKKLILPFLLTLFITGCKYAAKETAAEDNSESQMALAEQAFDQMFDAETQMMFGEELSEQIKKEMSDAVFETQTLDINSNIYANQEQRWLEEGTSQGWVLNAEDSFLETLTPDDSLEVRSDQKVNVLDPITTSGGQVDITFGTTQSDQINANQPIHPLMLDGLTSILEETNKHLVNMGSPPIASIHLSATTNGKHSPNSNHYTGLAVDISRINGVKMIRHNYSLILYMTEMQRLNFPDPQIMKDLQNQDLVLLYQRVLQMQASIQNLNDRRENFGPFLKTKFYKSRGQNNLTYEVGGHKDHIHFSVR